MPSPRALIVPDRSAGGASCPGTASVRGGGRKVFPPRLRALAVVWMLATVAAMAAEAGAEGTQVPGAVLPEESRRPPGSGGDRGFLVRTWQLAPPGLAQTSDGVIPAQLSWLEAVLAGLAGTNVADPTPFTAGGWSREPGVVDYQTPGPFGTPVAEGRFPADRPVPGLPGLSRQPTNNVVVDIRGFVEFDTAGPHRLEIQTDTPFLLVADHLPSPQPLEILDPPGLRGPMASVPSARENPLGAGGFGPLPETPMELETVEALSEGTAPLSMRQQGCGSVLANAEQIRGRAAIVSRGGCSFLEKVVNAAAAGARALLVVNDRSDFPIVMGALTNTLDIPALMISQADGASLRAAGTARVRIAAPSPPLLAQWVPASGGTRAVDLTVPAPGLYPLRLVWAVPHAPAALEWVSVGPDGTRRLLNDGGASARVFSSVGEAPPPEVRILDAGGVRLIRYTGVLQSAPEAAGPYTDVAGAPPGGDWPVRTDHGRAFYRARR